MSRVFRIAALALLCSFALLVQPALGYNDFPASCEGTESTGGGSSAYQYTLINWGDGPFTITLFYLGTMDLNVANYTNWVAPPGFTATVAPWDSLSVWFGTSVMATTMVKTPHGVVPPQQTFTTPGGIVWSGSVTVGYDQTVTFGFDHPNKSMDMEWLVEYPGGSNVTQGSLSYPIAGPSGTHSFGYIHGPGTEPTSTEPSTWGQIKALYQ